jgi:hypothetical protein
MNDSQLTTQQIIELLSDVAVMKNQLQKLTMQVADQEAEVRKLVLFAERGKGSFWMLLTLGGIAGAAITNFKSILAIFVR